MNENLDEGELYDELSLYTLEHAKDDPSFIHQYVVDAYAAQHLAEKTKPITTVFALIGLYLHIEKNYSGREVQLAHMELARKRKDWPVFSLPEKRGSVRVTDVLNSPSGKARDNMIDIWCASVWEAWETSHGEVGKLVEDTLGIIGTRN